MVLINYILLHCATEKVIRPFMSCCLDCFIIYYLLYFDITHSSFLHLTSSKCCNKS